MWPYPRARPRTIWRSRRNYRLLRQERGTRRCDRFVRDGLCQTDYPRSRRSCEGKGPGEIGQDDRGQDGEGRLDGKRAVADLAECCESPISDSGQKRKWLRWYGMSAVPPRNRRRQALLVAAGLRGRSNRRRTYRRHPALDGRPAGRCTATPRHA